MLPRRRPVFHPRCSAGMGMMETVTVTRSFSSCCRHVFRSGHNENRRLAAVTAVRAQRAFLHYRNWPELCSTTKHALDAQGFEFKSGKHAKHCLFKLSQQYHDYLTTGFRRFHLNTCSYYNDIVRIYRCSSSRLKEKTIACCTTTTLLTCFTGSSCVEIKTNVAAVSM